MERIIDKAKTLIEALPYIREFRKKTFVLKIGGSITETAMEVFAQDVVLLSFVGIRPVVVHGGGPKIDELSKDLGIQGKTIDGLRVTDEKTMEIVEMVLTGKINKDIVNAINSSGGKAVGISGKDGGLIEARKFDPRLGKVGDIERINPEILRVLEEGGYIPVVSPVGFGDGGTLNINADIAAGEIAGALKAEKLIYLTDVEGVLDESGNLITSITLEKAEELIRSGTAKGGMIPKLRGGIRALKKGCRKVHIINGGIPHAVLLEIFTKKGIGTEVVGS